MGLGGIEPPTSPLSGVRSSHLSYRPKVDAGGAGRDRTGDLLNANQALSQLSYSPSELIVIEAELNAGPRNQFGIQRLTINKPSGDNRDGMDRKDCQLLSRSYTDGFFTDSGHCLS